MKYYIISGEASGDLHASNLVRELKFLDPESAFRCWGGDLLAGEGVQLVRHYKDLAFMGFLEILFNLRIILNNIAFCKKDILAYAPDVLILVDYPGFNLRMAEFAHKRGIRVFYYISPQLWAWHRSRVKIIRKYVDRMFVILPFEKEFYAKYGIPVDYVGHPLLDVINERQQFSGRAAFLQKNSLAGKPIVALLPGSRLQEIRVMLRTMVRLIPLFPDCQFVVAGAPSIHPASYDSIMGEQPAAIVFNQTYDLLKHASAALVTSGTATLETALMRVPQVVCYKGNFFSYLVARQVVDVKYISLVNLIADNGIVKELIQGDFSVPALQNGLDRILNDPEARQTIISEYDRLYAKLGGSGASSRTASLMVQYLR